MAHDVFVSCASGDRPIVLRIASTVEKALLAELIEWRSHIRNQKLPQE
jgi:hypothetical protein